MDVVMTLLHEKIHRVIHLEVNNLRVNLRRVMNNLLREVKMNKSDPVMKIVANVNENQNVSQMMTHQL
jgi:hypothetical protein